MVAAFPPMGWNSWDCFGAAVTEEQVLRNASFMQKHLADLGWRYVVVDIEWFQPTASSHAYESFSELRMDEYGRLLPAVNRFPSARDGMGFAPLAKKIHNMGLLFGIHILRGLPRMAAHRHLPIWHSEYRCDQAADPSSVCAWNPDMYGTRADHPGARAYYESIFALYAEWGVDFVKCDDIARGYPEARGEIELISNAARGCGREIVLSLSPGPAPLNEAEHLKQYANMWRITDDFWDDFSLLRAMFERAEKWCIHAGPGHWPDADMLPVGALRRCTDPEGVTRFTPAEQRTMMTLWVMMRSPLMIGADLPSSDAFTLSLLTNRDVLEVLRTSWCGHPLFTKEDSAVWVAPRRDGTGCYAAFFNLSEKEMQMALPEGTLEYSWQKARELWTGNQTEKLSWTVSAHDSALFLLTT